MLLALDTETERFDECRKAPPLVCVSWATSSTNAGLFKHDGDGLDGHRSSAYRFFADALRENVTGLNVPYDCGVIGQWDASLIPNIFAAYSGDRITDVGIRQKLIDIARGDLLRPQKGQPGPYSLGEISRRVLGRTMEKGENTWRKRYGELMDVPLEQWPEAARAYPIGDVKTPLEIHAAQEHYAQYLESQYREARADWWLHLIHCWGFHTDQARLERFAKKIGDEYNVLEEILIREEIIRPDKKRTRNVSAVRARLEGAAAKAGLSVKMTDGGKKGIPAVSTDADTCKALAEWDPVLKSYARISSLKSLLSKDVVAFRGLPQIHPNFDSLLLNGRTSSYDPNTQNPPRVAGIREVTRARPGHVLIDNDYPQIELRTWAHVCLKVLGFSRMAELLNGGLDPHLDLGARIVGVSYEDAKARLKIEKAAPKGTPTPAADARQISKCFHPDTETLTRRGWVRICDLLPGEEIATPRHEHGKMRISWEAPLRLTNRFVTDGLVHLKNEGINLRVTADHRMCGWAQKTNKFTQYTPDRLGTARYWPNAGTLDGADAVSSSYETMVRVAIATQADGSFNGSSIRFGFTKQRKIDRFRALFCTVFGDQIREGASSQGATTFTIEKALTAEIRRWLTPEKTLPWSWLSMPVAAMRIAIEEARFWDGTKTGAQTQYQYCTTLKQNADVLQAMATLTGHKTRMRTETRHPAHHADPWILSVKNRDRTRGGNLDPQNTAYVGPVFCVTTRSDLVLVRDGGVPVITHQCANFGYMGGMGWQTFIGYAREQFDIVLSDEAAQKLHTEWLATWPEAKAYFAWIKTQHAWTPKRRADGSIVLGGPHNRPIKVTTIKHFVSGMVRGGAVFTDASNNYFSALAQTIGKEAMFYIARECYDESQQSILLGSRPINWIHDQVLVECLDDERAHDKAMRVAAIMDGVAELRLPDIKTKSEPCLARRWSKDAAAIYDARGRLLAWEEKEAA